jgi:hypothetical protein
MRRDALRYVLSAGFLFTGLSLCSALLQPRDSGEFVLSILSLCIGLMTLLLGFLLVFLTR